MTLTIQPPASKKTLFLVDLARSHRSLAEVSKVLPLHFIRFLRWEKTANPRVSIPEVIRRAVLERLIASEDDVCRQTVWRAARRLHLETRRRRLDLATPRRRRSLPFIVDPPTGFLIFPRFAVPTIDNSNYR